MGFATAHYLATKGKISLNFSLGVDVRGGGAGHQFHGHVAYQTDGDYV